MAPFRRRTIGTVWRGIKRGICIEIKVAIWRRMELWIVSRVIAAVLRRRICLRWAMSTKMRPTPWS
jgi:hypothetical protein